MKEIKDFWNDMDYNEKRDFIQCGISWTGLFILLFMISVIGG